MKSMYANLVRFANPDEPAMKAAIFQTYGDSPDVLEVRNDILISPDPETDPQFADCVRVKVMASSVNPIDWKLRKGDLSMILPNHFPKMVGRDFSGIVEKIGPKVTQWKVGDQVYGMAENLIGTNAEYVTCNERSCAHKPRTLDYNEAAAVPLAAVTAWHSLFEIAKLSKGQSVLILGGSGGVGSFATQLAKAKGIRAYVTCGAESMHSVKNIMGAYKVIDYKNEDFLDVLNGEKVDAVFDTIGSKQDRDRSFHAVHRGGMVVTTIPSDPKESPSILEGLKTLSDVVWKNVSNYATNRVVYRPMLAPDYQGPVLEQVRELIEEGQVKPFIDSVLPLNSIRMAHERSQSGRAKGKIVLQHYNINTVSNVTSGGSPSSSVDSK